MAGCWASNGWVLDYVADGNNAHNTIPRLSEFLRVIAEHTAAERIHILAHSMGNRPVCDVLGRFARERRLLSKLQHVLLAAPDVDCGTFTDLANDFSDSVGSVTLYASAKDKAMAVSRQFNKGQRAGEPMLIIPGVDSIDATAVETDFLSHGYFIDAQSMLSDAFYLLRDTPVHRRHLRPMQHTDGRYYRILG